MKDKKPLDWIPLWIDKHLFGSTRIELEPDERSVWTDMLAMAGKDKGFIRANEGCPYPPAQLAGMLIIPIELLERATKKFIKYKKVKKMRDGTLYLPSWEEYNFSDRHRRRLEAERADAMSAKADKSRTNADTIGENRIGKDRIEYKKVPKGTCESIGEKWNEFAEQYNLPKIKGMTKTRIGYLNQRWKDHFSKPSGISFDTLLDIIGKSPFLIGKTKHNFFCTFDWIIRPTNFQKIIEGNYLDRRFGELKRWLIEYGDKE